MSFSDCQLGALAFFTSAGAGRDRYYDVVPLLVASGARADWSGWGIQIEAPLARKFALIVEILTDFERPYR